MPLNSGTEFMLIADAGATLLLGGGGISAMGVVVLEVPGVVEMTGVITAIAGDVVRLGTVVFRSGDELVEALEVANAAVVAVVGGEEEVAPDTDAAEAETADGAVTAVESAPLLGLTGVTAETRDCDTATKLVGERGAVTVLNALLGHMHEHGTFPLQLSTA